MAKISKTYRPTQKEKFMNAKMKEYFRQKLENWKSELLKESSQTLNNLQTENEAKPDMTDRASEEIDRTFELRTRDRERKLINKIDAALELAGAGGFPTGTTWLSVPIFWPVNFSPLPLFVGWGPPLTPLGMIAYSLADFDLGEKKRARKRKAIKNAGKKCDGA